MGVKSCQSTDNAQPTGFYYVYFQSDGFLIPQVNPLYVTNTVLPAIADSLSYSPLSICIYMYIYLVCTRIYNIYSYIYIYIINICICHLTCHCFVSACGLTSVVRPGCYSLQSWRVCTTNPARQNENLLPMTIFVPAMTIFVHTLLYSTFFRPHSRPTLLVS